MLYVLYIIFINLLIGFWLGIELKRRYETIYGNDPTGGGAPEMVENAAAKNVPAKDDSPKPSTES
ncbi:MAG: hypothetical protein PVH19_02830 [Planctomycetia bacterium]|jgi:hypothetical protein